MGRRGVRKLILMIFRDGGNGWTASPRMCDVEDGKKDCLLSQSRLFGFFSLIHSLGGREPRQAFFLLLAFLLTGGMLIVGETLYMYLLGLLISYQKIRFRHISYTIHST
jgi:hypothetical protein